MWFVQPGKARRLIAAWTAHCLLGANLVLGAGQIVPDGNTRTTLQESGRVTEVTTQTIRGRNAYNSFHRFDVHHGNVVNLRLPDGTANLLNLVHDQASRIDGTLNAYRNGTIGGNVYFANPHGIVVGSDGVVNVGSLHASTPSAGFMQGFFDGPYQPSSQASAQLLSGVFPINADATISVQGTVNALGDIRLHGGRVITGGSLQAGQGRASGQLGFEDIVNSEGLESGVAVVERDGEILILGSSDVAISGELVTDGAPGRAAGAIAVHAGRDLSLEHGARVSASGQGDDSDGGRIDLLAGRDARLSAGATVAARGGLSGDGGEIEFSAERKVTLAGGGFDVRAPAGRGGAVLIDPLVIEATTAGTLVQGGDVTFEAQDSIVVAQDVVLSSRDVGSSTDHENAESVGDSGDITLRAPQITLESGSKLLAHATGNHAAGDILLSAAVEDHPGLTIADANSSIVIDGATLRAGSIALQASADALYDWDGTTGEIVTGLVPTFIEGAATILAGVNVGLAVARGTSTVTVRDGSVLEADGAVTLSALTTSSANTYRFVSAGALTGEVFGLAFIYGETKAHATIDLESGATVRASELTLDARNAVELNVNVYAFSTADSVEAAIALTHADVSSHAQIDHGADIQVSNSVAVTALNNNRFNSNSKAMALGAGKAGVAATIFTADTRALAAVDADLPQAAGTGELVIQALDSVAKNSAKASATTGSGFTAKPTTAWLLNYTTAKANEYIRSWLGKGKTPDERSNATEKARLAGAFTYVDSQQRADASVGAGAEIALTGDLVVDAAVVDRFLKVQAASDVQSEAKDPTPENPQTTKALSVAVTYGNYGHSADAHIGDGARVEARRVGVGSDVSVPWDLVWKKWDGLSTVLDSLGDSLDFENELLTTYSKAVSKAEEVNLAGVVNHLTFSDDSRAYLGKGTQIELLPGGAGSWRRSLFAGNDALGWTTLEREWERPLSILAANRMAGGFAAGNVGTTLFGTSTGDEGAAVGAAYNQVNYDNTTLAYVAEGAAITASNGSADVELLVRATSSEQVISLAPTAGKGGSYGLNGVFSLVDIANTTEASIDDEATVAAGQVRVEAWDEIVSWSLSGAVNKAESAAVGIGVALTDVTTDTSAFVGDNDGYYASDQNPTGSTLTIDDASVTAAGLELAARTDGRIESIAVAGSYSASSDPEKPSSRPRSNAVVEDTRSAWEKAKSWLKGKFSSGGNATQTEPKYGLGVSGAVAWNEVDLDTSARVASPSVTLTDGGLHVAAVNDTDIAAISGSAALVRANAKSSERSGGFAGALAVNDLENDTLAYLEDTQVLDSADAQILALAGGEQLAIAIGAAINASAEQDKAASAAGSVSVSLTENRVAAYAQDTTLSGDGSGDLDLIAYDRTRLGTGGGSLIVGGAGGLKGIGAAVTYSDIGNTVEAYAAGSILSGYRAGRIAALSNARLAAGGAMFGFTNDEADTTFAGAVVLSEIDNTTRAELKAGSEVTLTQSLRVLARDTTPVAALDQIVDAQDGGHANSASLDYDGTALGEDPDPGSSILSVAGVVQVGAGNVGVSFARSTISNSYTASLDDSIVDVTTGDVEVLALAATRIDSYAVGVGWATDEFAGAGSVTLNEIANPVTASVATATGKALDSDTLTVRAEDHSRIGSLAGQVTISQGSKAIGAAVAHNEIGNTLTAGASGLALDAQEAVSIEAVNESTIRTLSATAGGAEDFAFNGSASHAHIGNTTEALLSGSSADNPLALVTVAARDDSAVWSRSGGAALATGETGVGAALAVNRIGNTTKAHVSGVAADREYSIDSLFVQADSSADIDTLAIGLGGGAKVGIGGSVVTNFVDNDVLAYIDAGARVIAEQNVGVLAQSDDRITMAAGSAGIGLANAGVGASVSVNRIRGDTKAYIAGADTQVTARGLDSGRAMTVFAGELDAEVDLASAVDVTSYGSLDLADHKATMTVTGIAVNASATQHVENIDVNVAGSKAFAGGVTVNVNRISGATEAYVDRAAINALLAGPGPDQAQADLDVTASNHAYGNGFVGNLAIGGGASIGAATDVHSIDRTTLAHVSDSAIHDAGDVRVKALSTQGVSSAAIGGSAGIGGGAFAGTAAVASFGGTTEAYLARTDVTADSLAVLADSSNRMHLVGGALSVAGGLGVAGTFTLGISDGVTRAYVEGEAGTAATLDVAGQVTIDASSVHDFTSYAVGGALAGSAGVAGAVTVNLFTNTTEAWLRDVDAGSADDRIGSLDISASNSVSIGNMAGAVGAGIAAGFGAGGNLSILKSRVVSGIEQSRVFANESVSVTADSGTGIDADAYLFGVGGTLGIGGAAVVVLAGSDLVGEAAAELDSGDDGTLSQMQSSLDGTDLDAVDNDQAMSASEREDMEASASHQVSEVAYGEQAEQYQYQTAARVIGSETVIDAGMDIGVHSTDSTRVDVTAVGAGASVTGLGVGGAVAIVSLEGKSSAYVNDGALKAVGDIRVVATGKVEDTDVITYAGGAGVVGLGAAYADVGSTPQTLAYLGPLVEVLGADELVVEATTTSDIDVEGKGLVVGSVAVGVVIAGAEETGNTAAYVDTGAKIGSPSAKLRSVSIQATTDQALTADTGAAAGGIVAGQGSVATVEASPTVRAFAGDGATIHVAEHVKIGGDTVIDTSAVAKGITVAGAGAGVSLATATATPDIHASVGSDAVIDAGQGISVRARQTTDELSSTATASFGGLIGAAASDATTVLTPTVKATVGDGAELNGGSGEIALSAIAANKATATSDGWVGAVAAWGANSADARIESAVTEASLGAQVNLRADALTLRAQAVNDAYASSTAGAGGVVVGASSDANTRIDSATRAFITDNAADNAALISTARDLTISADEVSVFNSQSDSTAGGVVGYSGAVVDDDIDALVEASIGRNSNIHTGGDLKLVASNATRKGDVGRNTSAGAGGVLGLSAGDGDSTVDNTTEARIGGNENAAEHRILADGSVKVAALNDVDSYSYGSLSAGGLVANADIEMESTANSTARASIGEYASVGAGEDIEVRSRSDADVETKAHTSTYGVSASGVAIAKTWIDNTNEALVAANAGLQAGRDIHVTAGAGLDGLRNQLRGKAEGRSWAKGLFPSGTVTGWSTIENVNRVNLAAGSELQAGQDVNLGSYAGSVSTDGYAKAKKTSYLFFGIPINLYSDGSRRSVHNATTSVTVDGAAHSGTNHHRWLDIPFDGVITGNIGYGLAEDVDLRAELGAEIDLLDEQIANETTDLKVALENRQARLVAKRDALPDPAMIDRITLEDAVAQGGSVHVDGQLSGNGSLRTPGNDLRIEIINNSPAHLVTNRLEIPLSSQGQITLNGRRITSHPGMTVEYGPSALPEIFIGGYYNHETGPVGIPTEIRLNGSQGEGGDIINLAGSVIVENQFGDLTSTAKIIADTIDIAVGGDFVQEYTSGVTNSENVIAGNNISISAEVLNINGTLQSGIPYRTVVIDPFTDADIEERGGEQVIRPDAQCGGIACNIRVVWDDEKQLIKVDPVRFGGGYIELFGEIASTGGGELKLFDGYGEINVVNNTDHDVVLRSMNIGEPVVGLARIFDTGKVHNGAMVRTDITADGVERYYRSEENGRSVWNLFESAPRDNRATQYSYEPRKGLRYLEYRDITFTNKPVTGTSTHWWTSYGYSNDQAEGLFGLSWLTQQILEPTGALSGYFGTSTLADTPIPVTFLGRTDNGVITVVNNGRSDILLNGALRNPSGPVTLTGAHGDIRALHDSALIAARDIDLGAPSGGIGSVQQAVGIDLGAGQVNAAALASIHLHERDGDLRIGSVVSGEDVGLSADGSIIGVIPGTPAVMARDITFTTINGGIGRDGDALALDSRGVVSAAALSSVYITEQTGDLRVNKVVSESGDVVLVAPGAIEDYNFFETVDQDVKERLINVWEAMELQNAGKVDDAIALYKAQKKAEYQEQHRLDDGGTFGYTGDDTFDSSYDPNYEYQLTAEEQRQYNDAVWTDEELLVTKNVLTVPQSANDGTLRVKTEVLVEDPNIEAGGNVVLRAGAGIGEHLGDIVITQDRIDAGDVTQDEKLAIIAAERDDLAYETDDRQLRVSKKRDFDIAAAGSIDLQARDFVFLGSETDINIARADSQTSNIRLKVSGSISNANDRLDVANLKADDLIIEAAAKTVGGVDQGGNIGIPDRPVVVDLRPGGTLTPRADGAMYLTEHDGDMTIDRLLSGGPVILTVANGNFEAGLLFNQGYALSVDVMGDTLKIDELYEPYSVDLHVAGEGGTARVGKLTVNRVLAVRADNILLPDVQHSAGAPVLYVGLTGNDGGVGDSQDFSIHSTGQVVFDRLGSQELVLVFDSDAVRFDSLQVGQWGDIKTPTHHVIIDHRDHFLHGEATAQLFAPDRAFWLRLTAHRLLLTNAFIVNYDPGFIVNDFSTENSVTRLQPKRSALSDLLYHEIEPGYDAGAAGALVQRRGWDLRGMSDDLVRLLPGQPLVSEQSAGAAGIEIVE